ncbi:aminoglycoside phosphotransferase family protein [Modestobacter sp. URMC 112]
MAPRGMHTGQVPTDVDLVRRLVRRQFPRWAALPVRAVATTGTDHDVYRLGDELVVRLPIVDWAAGQAASEARWLPVLAPYLPLAVPVPLALGEPGEDHPFPWAVCRWLPGRDAHGSLRDLDRAADDLAGFVRALRGVPTTCAPERPPGARGGPHAERDASVRGCVAVLGDRVDGPAVLRCWEQSLEAPPHAGPEVWLHGDLLAGNLLVVDGRLSAVIDFGGLAVGDLACDLQPAWQLFHGRSRARFLDALDADPAARLRGRGWVLSQAVMALPYYWDTNPAMVRQASAALFQVLADTDD